MKKIIPICSLISLLILTSLITISPTKTQASNINPTIEGIQVDYIVDGLKDLNREGLHRIIDSHTNKVIYILITGQAGKSPAIAIANLGN